MLETSGGDSPPGEEMGVGYACASVLIVGCCGTMVSCSLCDESRGESGNGTGTEISVEPKEHRSELWCPVGGRSTIAVDPESIRWLAEGEGSKLEFSMVLRNSTDCVEAGVGR